MKNINPDKPYAAKNWHADAISDRMGFAMRNETATQQQSGGVIPIDTVGRDIAGKLNVYQYDPSPTEIAEAGKPNWSVATAAPGIMVLEYEPNIAPDGGTRIIDDIYTQRWSDLRLFNNGVDAVQPNDLSAISVAYMLLESYLTEAERLFSALRVGAEAENNYWRPEVLARALGFSCVGTKPDMVSDNPMEYPPYDNTFPVQDDLTRGAIAENYTAWVTYYNTEILGYINAMRWMNTTFAGGHRWASLNREIYKDTSADTFFCQMYVLRPRTHWQFKSTLQVAQADKSAKGEAKAFSNIVRGGKALRAGTPYWAWSFSSDVYNTEATAPTRPIPNMTNYGISQGARYYSVWGFLRFLRAFVWNMFYDSGADDVQALLGTISKRSEATATQLGISEMSYEPYPYEGKVIPLTYDWDMLNAIHNATLAPNISMTAVTQLPATGQLQQRFAILDAQRQDSASLLQDLPKFIELPTMAASKEQLINAMQWHLTYPLGLNTSETHNHLTARYLGSDMLVRAFIIRYTDPNASTEPATGKLLYTLRATDVSEYQCRQYTKISTGEFIDQATFFRLILLHQFDSHPLFYTYHSCDTTDGDPRGELDMPLTDMECIYPAPAAAVLSTKEQFMYNFWGFPLRLEKTGTFSSGEVKVTQPNAVPLENAGTQP